MKLKTLGTKPYLEGWMYNRSGLGNQIRTKHQKLESRITVILVNRAWTQGGRDCMLGGKVLKHRGNRKQSLLDSAQGKERNQQAPQPLQREKSTSSPARLFTVFSVSLQGLLLALLRPLLFSEICSFIGKEQEVDLRASKQMTVHLT